MKKLISLIFLTTLLLNGCSSSTTQTGDKKIEPNPVADNQVTYFMAGKVEVNDQANITSKISAKIMQISVDVGAHVNKGDVLITLDTKDIEAQVNQAAAGVATAQANLDKVQSGSRTELIGQAKASVDSTAKNYENAKSNYDRTNQLFQSGAASKQQLETAEVQCTVAEAQYKSAKEQLDMLTKGETQETINVLKAQVKQAEAALEIAQTQLSYGTILSPLSGIVSAKSANVGEIASSSQTLLTIVSTDSLFVNAYLPAGLLNQVKPGQEVTVKVSEVPDKNFNGEISVINPVIDSKSKNVLVKISLKDANSELKPGMFAQIGFKK